MGGGGRGHVAEAKMRYPSHQVTKFNQKSLCDISSAKWLSTKNRSTRRSTPSHPIAMASTAKPPDPMPCALAAILLPESRAHGCHMQKTLFPGTYWVHTGECVLGPFLRAGWVRRGCAGVWAAAWVRIVGVRKGHPDHHKYTLRSRHW